MQALLFAALEVAAQVVVLELAAPQLEELLLEELLAAQSEASPVAVFAAALGQSHIV
jgi:hypothetical protein